MGKHASSLRASLLFAAAMGCASSSFLGQPSVAAAPPVKHYNPSSRRYRGLKLSPADAMMRRKQLERQRA